MPICTPMPRAPATCAVCDGHDRVKAFGEWLVGQDMMMCWHCFVVWYDEGQTERVEIRKRSLAHQGRTEN